MKHIPPKEVIINSDIILNSLTDGVVVISSSRKILYMNRAARKLFSAVEYEKVEGNVCKDILNHSECSLCCLMGMAIKSGKDILNKELTIGKDGKLLTLTVNVSPIRDEEGNIIGAVEIFRDVSLVKELKEELAEKYSFEGIIGRNYKMQEIFELLYEVAPTKTTVLIEGESGTGKELIAKAIHYRSPRRNMPFIKLNCAALAEGVLESELFGHVKGAFTGAVTDKPGRFELADKGTIFLDEIGDIPSHTQLRLLRVLQESEFERVGGTKTIKVDVRVIAATNKDLKKLVEEGRFREDLYYRLKVVPIKLPPLRERKDDIPLLVRHFIEKFNKEMDKNILDVSQRAMDILMAYNYPGNIRELEHIIEHAFVRCNDKLILPDHLPEDVRDYARDRSIVERAIESERPLEAIEREALIKILDECGWRMKECAQRLKVSRPTLWRRMKKLGIEKKGKRPQYPA